MTPEEQEAFRAKYNRPKNVPAKCMDCKFLMPQKPKRRCSWCALKKEGTDAEVTAAMLRVKSEHSTAEDYRPPGFGFCTYCFSIIPEFYMVSGKRCRGCHLTAQRDRDALKKYGLQPGERQKMYDAQGGVCFGCLSKQRVTGLAVHHSHLTGEPYFLACLTCNKLVMGNAHDNPQTLLRLALGMLIPPHKPGNMALIEGFIKEINDASDSA